MTDVPVRPRVQNPLPDIDFFATLDTFDGGPTPKRLRGTLTALAEVREDLEALRDRVDGAAALRKVRGWTQVAARGNLAGTAKANAHVSGDLSDVFKRKEPTVPKGPARLRILTQDLESGLRVVAVGERAEGEQHDPYQVAYARLGRGQDMKLDDYSMGEILVRLTPDQADWLAGKIGVEWTEPGNGRALGIAGAGVTMHVLDVGQHDDFSHSLIVGSDERAGRDADVAHAQLLGLLAMVEAPCDYDW
ncbi:hypothetical protein [Baekduia sp. Peel2402]|uniref:hypothetical protein n=1 Tax=Baekduia sp. Peel2402 TaxID=3458296 RepID=UPI00403EA8B8